MKPIPASSPEEREGCPQPPPLTHHRAHPCWGQQPPPPGSCLFQQPQGNRARVGWELFAGGAPGCSPPPATLRGGLAALPPPSRLKASQPAKDPGCEVGGHGLPMQGQGQPAESGLLLAWPVFFLSLQGRGHVQHPPPPPQQHSAGRNPKATSAATPLWLLGLPCHMPRAPDRQLFCPAGFTSQETVQLKWQFRRLGEKCLGFFRQMEIWGKI